MKVGYLCADVDVQVLGQEGCSVHVREFTNGLVEAGHEAFMLCAWAGEGDGSRLRAPLHELGPRGVDAEVWASLERDDAILNHHLERDLRSVLWNTWLRDQGDEIVARERPDFLYERYSLFGWGGTELARRHGIPLILEVNAPLCDEQDGYEKFALTETARRMQARILGQADALVVVSGWLGEWAEAQGVDPARIHVIPNGVSSRFLDEEISGDAVRAELGLQGTSVVGFVGSFHWWHDVGGLLKAFSALADRDPALRLLLVGSGEKRKRLESRVAELGLGPRVVFTGKVPHDRVPEYVAAMDVAVVPYGPLKEFFFSPVKLFEYMAAGRPTVAASLGQIPEIVEHAKTGWLYPPGDAARLAEGIETFLRDPDLAARASAAARDVVRARHTWKHIADRVAELGRELATPQASDR